MHLIADQAGGALVESLAFILLALAAAGAAILAVYSALSGRLNAIADTF